LVGRFKYVFNVHPDAWGNDPLLTIVLFFKSVVNNQKFSFACGAPPRFLESIEIPKPKHVIVLVTDIL